MRITPLPVVIGIILVLITLTTWFPTSTSATGAHYTQVQQTIYNTLSVINSLDDLSQQDYQNMVYSLGYLNFDQFLLGLSHPSPVVKQITMQTFQNILRHHSPLPNHPNKEHPYTQVLESLSLNFITYHKKTPITYTQHTLQNPPSWAKDTQYNHRETELIGIIQPIVNIATLEKSSPLRHVAIASIKLVIQQYPGTVPTTIRLLQYLSGQDVFIGGTFYAGSQYSGVENFINQQFLSKIVRLHLSSIWTDDYEILRRASLAVLELYNGAHEETGNDESANIEEEDDAVFNDPLLHEVEMKPPPAPRHETLRFDPNAPMKTMKTMQIGKPGLPGAVDAALQNVADSMKQGTSKITEDTGLKRINTVYTQMNFVDPDIDILLTEISTIISNSEDFSIIYESTYALSESKISTEHLNTFYSLVISPDYNTSYYALAGIKRIALLSAIPGTIYITANADSQNSQPQQSLKPQVSKYVQAVSQAELTTLINPSHGQLAIKILKHSSSKHPNHYLQQYSSLAFDDVISEVKAQLQNWYSMTAEKGLVVYKETDHSQSNLNDLKFYHRYNNLSSSISRGRLVDKFQQWQDQTQGKHYMTDMEGNKREASSVQQLLYMAKRGLKAINTQTSKYVDHNPKKPLKNPKDDITLRIKAPKPAPASTNSEGTNQISHPKINQPVVDVLPSSTSTGATGVVGSTATPIAANVPTTNSQLAQ